MATFWAKNGSAWLCFQFWVPKISLLFIPPGFIHPQEWKLRVQNHKILVKKRWFFFTIDAVYAHWCASDAHWCASAKIGAWPSLIEILESQYSKAHPWVLGRPWQKEFGFKRDAAKKELAKGTKLRRLAGPEWNWQIKTAWFGKSLTEWMTYFDLWFEHLSSHPVICNFFVVGPLLLSLRLKFSPNESPKQARTVVWPVKVTQGGSWKCINFSDTSLHHAGMFRLWKVTQEMPNFSFSDTSTF